MSSDSLLSAKTAVVTGASSGIGRAIAERLGASGAHVFLTGRTEAAMRASAERIEKLGGCATVSVFDVRDVSALRGFVDEALRRTGRLDVMVNNAGLSHPGSIIDGDPEQWRVMLETNVLALLVGAQAAIRAMRSCGAHGHIVNVSSIAAQRADSGVYGSTKHAVNCISATLRRELEEDTIRVVNVMPGAIATNFARHFDPAFVGMFAKAAGVEIDVKAGERLPDEVFEQLSRTMKQTLCAPEDVAEAVLFAVTRPIHVQIADIVVRPPKQLNL